MRDTTGLTGDAGPPSAPSGIVQRVDAAPNVVVLEVRVPGRTSLVIVAAPKMAPIAAEGASVGLLIKDTRQAVWGARLPPAARRTRAREDALHGARVLALGVNDVAIEQGGAPRVVRAQGGRVVITDEDPASKRVAARGDFFTASDAARATWEAHGKALAEALAAEATDQHREELARVLQRARAKIIRRREAIEADLSRIADADRIASRAEWLVAEASRTPRGATKMVVTDWSTGEAVPFEIPLDPARRAREQVEAMFKRAKRLRLGGTIARERLARTEHEERAIVDALRAVEDAETTVAMDEAVREAKRAAPRDLALPGQAGTAPPRTAVPGRTGAATRRTPYRVFVAQSGRKLFVGKGAADNDLLTLHVAKPHDLWLHAKDRAGAHVIVPIDKGQSCPGDDLVDAAHLAAHFSDRQKDAVVDIQYTPKRYLRKPKGSPPGFVVVDREKVLALRIDHARTARLLEREELGVSVR